jgi:muramoyltetrapeptide carboxypeptidase
MPEAALPLIRPRRLQAGDTIGLINPSGAIYERAPFEQTQQALQALGFQVREAPNVRARYGHMAGTPAQRASDIHTLFADPGIAGILAITGGSGANRVLPLLDYDLIAANPKFLGGFSDLTALISAVHVKTGLVTFHSPLGRSAWNAFSVGHFQAVAVQAQAHLLRNTLVQGDDLVPSEGLAIGAIAGARVVLNASELALLQRLLRPALPRKRDGELMGPEAVWLHLLDLVESWCSEHVGRRPKAFKLLRMGFGPS